MRKRVLESVARFACRRYGVVLIVALLVTLLSWTPPIVSYLRGGLHASFDVSKMLPQDVRAARDFTRAVTDFDSADEAVVVFHLGKPGDQSAPPSAREQFVPIAGRIADRLVEILSADKRIQNVFCRKFRPEDRNYMLYEALPDFGLLLLNQDEMPRVKELLQPDQIRKSVATLKTRSGSSVSSAMKMDEWILLDAIGLGTVFKRSLARYGVEDSSTNAAAMGNYLVDNNRTMLLTVIQPDRPAQSVSFAYEIMNTIRAAAQQACDELLPEGTAGDITIEFGGGYEAASRYTSHVNENLLSTLATSLIGVLLLFGFIYKRVGVLLYVGAPLVMIVSWTVGVGWVMFGQLNIISAAFAAVLVGLGIDYAIHIYNRYIFEREGGAEMENAFVFAITSTGWGVILGMVTTAFAFLALTSTRFNQLAEFGVLAGIGIVLAAPAMLFVLPALLSWRRSVGGEREAILHPSSLGLTRLASVVDNHRKGALVVGVILALLCALQLYREPGTPRFNEGIANLRPQERVFELGGEIARAFSNRNPNQLMLLAYGDTEEDAVEKAASLDEICRRLEKETMTLPGGKQSPVLLAYETPLKFIPPPSAQRNMLNMLKEIDLDGALAVFKKAVEDEGLDEDYFGFTTELLERHSARVKENKILLPTDLAETPVWRYIKRFVTQQRRMIDLREPIPGDIEFPVRLATPALARDESIKGNTGDVMTRDQIIALYSDPNLDWSSQVKRVSIYEPSGWAVKTSVYPPLDQTTRAGDPLIAESWLTKMYQALGITRNDEAMSADLNHYLREPILTGIPLLAHELAVVVKQDFRRVSMIVFATCAIVICVFFYRNLMEAVMALVPLLLGVLYLFGFMSLFGIDFNFVNILVVPIIIGLGVDNGIHLVERYRDSGRRLVPLITDTGRALIVTALTSVAGFGSLAISGYKGTASMGRLTIYALFFVLVASLVVLPPLISYCLPAEKKPESQE